MKTIMLSSGVSTTLPATTAIGYQIESIEMDIPLNDVGNYDSSVTLSGVYTGSYTFHSSVHPKLRFGSNEAVEISTDGLTNEMTAIIGYTQYGDQSMYMEYAGGSRGTYIPISTSLKQRLGIA